MSRGLMFYMSYTPIFDINVELGPLTSFLFYFPMRNVAMDSDAGRYAQKGHKIAF